VQRQLASGRYNNASEVVRDALRLMEEWDVKLQALRATLDMSISVGGARPCGLGDDHHHRREIGEFHAPRYP
jgi:antitoxin ParD1/3/4